MRENHKVRIVAEWAGQHAEIDAEFYLAYVKQALMCRDQKDEPTIRLEESLDGGESWEELG